VDERRKWQGNGIGDAPSSSCVSVTTPSTSDVPLRTATAFLVASARTSALAAAAGPPGPATRRSEWKGRAEEEGAAKRAAGGAKRKVCAAMAAAAAAFGTLGGSLECCGGWVTGGDKVGSISSALLYTRQAPLLL